MSEPETPSQTSAEVALITVEGYSPRYARAARKLLQIEGGFVDDPKDRGGATKYGISLRFLAAEGAFDEDGDGKADFDLDLDGDIDGQDIRDVTQDSLRQAIAMIPQDPALFHRSVMDNIRYGQAGASDDEVIRAAKQASAHTFIQGLPEGYASLMGERGVRLSGGQRQRIAIARAILKNAPILILDEATSQLDSLTEHDIQTSLRQLFEHRTTLVIAHRLSTLLHMDRILVFDHGQIIEDGSHEELLAKNGVYTALWYAQQLYTPEAQSSLAQRHLKGRA